MFNNLSVVELIEAISDLSGVTLQIHKDFKPIFVTPDYARLYGFDSTEQFLKLGSIMDLIPDDKKDLAIKRYQEIIRTGRASSLTLKSQRQDGTHIWVTLQDRRLKYGQHGYCVMTVLLETNNAIQSPQPESTPLEPAAFTQTSEHAITTNLREIRLASMTVEKLMRETQRNLTKKTLTEAELLTTLNEVFSAVNTIQSRLDDTNEHMTQKQ